MEKTVNDNFLDIFKKIMKIIEEKELKLLYFKEEINYYTFGIFLSYISDNECIVSKYDVQDFEKMFDNIYWDVLIDSANDAYILEIKIPK